MGRRPRRPRCHRQGRRTYLGRPSRGQGGDRHRRRRRHRASACAGAGGGRRLRRRERPRRRSRRNGRDVTGCRGGRRRDRGGRRRLGRQRRVRRRLRRCRAHRRRRREAFGRLDILVNNASVFRDGPFSTMSPEDFGADVAVHLFGAFHMCKHASAGHGGARRRPSHQHHLERVVQRRRLRRVRRGEGWSGLADLRPGRGVPPSRRDRERHRPGRAHGTPGRGRCRLVGEGHPGRDPARGRATGAGTARARVRPAARRVPRLRRRRWCHRQDLRSDRGIGRRLLPARCRGSGPQGPGARAVDPGRVRRALPVTILPELAP